MRGVSLTGALHFLEMQSVAVGQITGVSIGSVVAALATNGYSPEEIKLIFVDDLKPSVVNSAIKGLVPSILEPVRRLGGAQAVLRSLIPPFWDPVRLLGGGLIDLLPTMQGLVKELNLKPNNRLRIVAYDAARREPIVFEGCDYDLAMALAASCSVPGLFRPVMWRNQDRTHMLYDGGIFHPQPGISEAPSIIFKLIDYPFLDLVFPDRKGDFVASVGDQMQAFFGKLSLEKAERLFWDGYAAARDALSVPLKRGEIPVTGQA